MSIPDDYRESTQIIKSQFLSFFILALIIFFLGVNISYAVYIPGYKIPVSDIIGYFFLISQLIISRTRWYRIAIILMFAMFPLVTFSNILGGTSPNVEITLSFLVVSYFLGTIFLSRRGIVLYGLSINLLILFLPIVAPEIVDSLSSILGALAINFVGLGVTVVGTIYRERVEISQNNRLRAANDASIEGLARALELHSKETEGHSRRVVSLTLQVADRCGITGEDLQNIRRGALLHDIGKMGIPDQILLKKEPLTEDEWEVITQHPNTALQMLEPIPFVHKAIDIPYCHHERWDGSGYPRGLKGEEIPLAARIFAVVDVFDAMTSERSYKDGMSREEAIGYIKSESGKKFDPGVVAIFLEVVGQ